MTSYSSLYQGWASGGPVQIPPTIEDPTVVEHLRQAFAVPDAQSIG